MNSDRLADVEKYSNLAYEKCIYLIKQICHTPDKQTQYREIYKVILTNLQQCENVEVDPNKNTSRDFFETQT